MSKSTRNKSLLYKISAVLILVAAILFLFFPDIAPYVMIAGVAGFGAVTFTTPYLGESIRGKRLFNMQIFSVILMAVSTYLMFIKINEWVIPMLIAAILLLYSSMLLPRIYEQEKEEENKKK